MCVILFFLTKHFLSFFIHMREGGKDGERERDTHTHNFDSNTFRIQDIYMCWPYIYIVVSCPTPLKGDPQTPFFNSYYPKVLGDCDISISWIVLLTLASRLVMLSIKKGSIKYHFLSLWNDSKWDWNIPSLQDHWLTPYPLWQYIASPLA